MRAVYGSIAMRREFCPSCEEWALVSSSEMACCGATPPTTPSRGIRRMTLATGHRKIPTVQEQREILARQKDRCFYCGSVFGDLAHCEGRADRWVKINWDHVEPFCWQSNNQTLNFVAACSVCNGIKSSKVFPTQEETIKYVWDRRKKKGWVSATEEPPNNELRELWRALPNHKN